MVRMGQEWQGSSARRRSLESAMKESQARTKVVLRHLPPSLTSSVLHEQILSKYAGTINWFAFHPGKSRWAWLFPFLLRCLAVELFSCLGFSGYFYALSCEIFDLSLPSSWSFTARPSVFGFPAADFQLEMVIPKCSEAIEWTGSFVLWLETSGKSFTDFAAHIQTHSEVVEECAVFSFITSKVLSLLLFILLWNFLHGFHMDK